MATGALPDGLRTFSKTHAAYVAALLGRIQAHDAERLTALVVFGSYARGENHLGSDLDLFIVLS
jgi:predicted nucleotidyltransferase